MSFSALLLVVFGFIAFRNLGDIQEAERADAVVVGDPIIAQAGDNQIATAQVRFTTEAGRPVETFVVGVSVDTEAGDTIEVHYLASEPEDATFDDPPNRTLSLILSVVFALIGAGGIWSFGHDFPFPDEGD